MLTFSFGLSLAFRITLSGHWISLATFSSCSLPLSPLMMLYTLITKRKNKLLTLYNFSEHTKYLSRIFLWLSSLRGNSSSSFFVCVGCVVHPSMFSFRHCRHHCSLFLNDFIVSMCAHIFRIAHAIPLSIRLTATAIHSNVFSFDCMYSVLVRYVTTTLYSVNSNPISLFLVRAIQMRVYAMCVCVSVLHTSYRVYRIEFLLHFNLCHAQNSLFPTTTTIVVCERFSRVVFGTPTLLHRATSHCLCISFDISVSSIFRNVYITVTVTAIDATYNVNKAVWMIGIWWA